MLRIWSFRCVQDFFNRSSNFEIRRILYIGDTRTKKLLLLSGPRISKFCWSWSDPVHFFLFPTCKWKLGKINLFQELGLLNHLIFGASRKCSNCGFTWIRFRCDFPVSTETLVSNHKVYIRDKNAILKTELFLWPAWFREISKTITYAQIKLESSRKLWIKSWT